MSRLNHIILFAGLGLVAGPATSAAQMNMDLTSHWKKNGTAIHSKNGGSVGIGTATPVGAKLHVNGWIRSTGLALDDDMSSILFPVASGATQPMIFMYGTAASNATRMVLAHSPLVTNYGLQYSDVARRFTFVHGGAPIFEVDSDITAHQPLHVHQGIQATGGFSWYALHIASDQDSIVFGQATNPSPEPMIQMFDGGTQNNDRMVLAHSPVYENWGLQYRDSADEFHFLSSGNTVMNVDLGSSRVAIASTSTSGTAKLQVGDAGDGSFAVANSWSLFSSREYKKDIEQLDEADCQRVMEDVMATPVYRFRYKGEAEDVAPRLGLIVEESPDAVLSEQAKAVDLGRYVTALHAALKAQSAELDSLRQAVQELRGEH